jgi:hypothetical protein
LDTLILVHDRLSNAVILFMAVVGAWGMLAYFRGDDLGGSLGGTFVIGQLLLVAQTVFGVILLFMGGRPLDSLHYMYGIVIVLLLPFAYTFVRERAPRTGLLLCSSAALLIAALAWRATITGGG